MMKLTLLALLIAPAIMRAQAPITRLPTDDEIRALLVNRIDVQRKSYAIVVGVVSKHGRQVVAYGRFDAADPRLPDGETVFEIGSISKVFTALLLSDMAQRGEVKLSDPIAKYLPPSVNVPSRNSKQITLLDLAMHRSGLPRLPSNLVPKDSSNPYAEYTVEQMFDFLSHYQLTRDPGEKYDYSNLGGALLGNILALHAGTNYETLLRTRITTPLHMNNTAVVLTPEMAANLAPGHDQGLRKVSNWDMPAFAGAGGIRSTTDDLLTFLAANMGLVKTPLLPAMKKMLSVRKPATAGVDIAMGWHIITGPQEIVFHNGGTGGYYSYVGFDPHKKVGVVVLSNAGISIDDIGRRMLSFGSGQVQGPVRHNHVGP